MLHSSLLLLQSKRTILPMSMSMKLRNCYYQVRFILATAWQVKRESRNTMQVVKLRTLDFFPFASLMLKRE